jgi:Mg-chelatase subunit ChlD
LDWELELTRPIYLLGLLVVPLLAVYFYRSLVDFGRMQRLISLVVRSVVVLLLVLSLAGLALVSPTDRRYVVVAVDQSLSVDDEAAKTSEVFLRQLKEAAGENEIAVLPFASEPEDVAPLGDDRGIALNPSSEKDAATPTGDEPVAEQTPDRSQSAANDPRMGTNLARAIEVATAAIPPSYVPSLVVISDGNETDGDAVRAALSAGIPISTIPLPTRDEPEVQVAAARAPAEVRLGEPFYLEVDIVSNREGSGILEIYRGDIKILEEEQGKIQLKKGENTFRFRQEIADGRLTDYSVRVRGFEDTLLDNNSASALVSAAGKPRVLLADSSPQNTEHLRWALAEHDIQIDVRPPEGVPADLADLQNYELVMLSNVPATSLSMRQMDVLRTYVQDLGGGLIMLGGDQSFGLGGYYKTTIEEILPVRSNFEKEKEKPSLAMVLIIDKSGSMGGMKIELAKDAAKSAVELLGARDQVGVIAFDGASYWVSEIHSASDRNYVSERISTIVASGGTSMYPPMVDAYEALSATVAKLKHVIILTDGMSSPGDFEGIASQMAAERMTISTVGIGDGAHQDLLERISQIGSGRYYFCDDPQSVPQIFAKETVTASKSAINEMPFVPQVVRPAPALAEIDLSTAPFLLGYVVTRPKPTCEFILATESGEPLLAWWRYGLGMTCAFTSDAKSRWAAEWLSWPQFSTFWAQLVRHTMRKSEAKGVYVEVHRDGPRAEVQLDVVDELGRFRNEAEVNLAVIRPDIRQGREEIALRQTAPGRYTAEFDTDKQGTYHLELSQTVGTQLAFRQTRGLVVGYPDELRLRPTNEDLLRQVASVSGGAFNPDPASIFSGDGTAQEARPLWPWLLSAALGLFLLDVALRRIEFRSRMRSGA